MPRGGGKGRGGGYGPKKNYKGQRRHFTDAEELQQQLDREKKQKEWRKQQGVESDEEEDSGNDGAKAKTKTGAPGELPPSDSESETDSDDEDHKAKGVEHLIEIQNPNRSGGRQMKKVSELGDSKTQLSRREREELEKQQAKVRYQQLHMQGKTEEARSDLARLAIIRKQREEALKKRDEEKKAKEEKGNS